MTRCIFRKPKRQLSLGHGLAIVTVMLGAALCLELQAELNPPHQTVDRSALVGQLHHP